MSNTEIILWKAELDPESSAIDDAGNDDEVTWLISSSFTSGSRNPLDVCAICSHRTGSFHRSRLGQPTSLFVVKKFVITMSAAAVSSVVRAAVRGAKHWPHKSPALTVRFSLAWPFPSYTGTHVSIIAHIL
jgi:hypothetical protein